MSPTVRPVAAGATALAAALLLAACGDSSTAPGGENELITRVTLTLTPAAGGTPLTAYIDDADGNGPQSPSAQVGALALRAGTTYTGTVKFENRLASPIEDITEEVEEEANEHRVYYTVAGGLAGSGLTITTTDRDPQGRPLGVTFSAVAGSGAAGQSGTLRVVLCHYDDRPKVASSTSCQGETDIDVLFSASATP
jgi:hypothetical protein